MSVIRWEEPPCSTPGGPGKSKPIIAHDLIAYQLRSRPGEWALVVEGAAHGALASTICRGGLRAYAPAGTFKAVSRTVGPGQNIYARYVGEDGAPC